MELSADGNEAACPYCGHRMLIEKEELAQKEYARRIAKARVEEDIKDLQRERLHQRRLKGWLIALCAVAGICLINVLIPDSPMHELAFPRTADPFTTVSVKFSGMSGEGRAELQISARSAAEYADGERIDVVNLKLDPEMIEDVIKTPGIFPAFHMNRRYWVTVILDGTVDAETLAPLIEMSYNLTMRKVATSTQKL